MEQTMDSLLPQIADRKHYAELFKQNSHWDRAIKFLIEKHKLTGNVQRGVLGSHIVYRVGDCWIKLMAPLFAKDMAYELSGLRAVSGKLSVRSPEILGEGTLEGWQYVILSHIEGNPIRNVWTRLEQQHKTKLAEQIARVTIEISKCKADDVIENRFVWNEFIKNQYVSCEEQQKKKGLPDEWLAHVREFLHSFDLSEFQAHNQVFLHADLTFDHFLVSQDTEPRVSGIIDLADCQIGNFEYELCAPTVFIFKGSRPLLKQYLTRCGFALPDLNARFSEKLLAWSILHRYFSMISYFQEEMKACEPGDFKSLAQKVFPLSV